VWCSGETCSWILQRNSSPSNNKIERPSNDSSSPIPTTSCEAAAMTIQEINLFLAEFQCHEHITLLTPRTLRLRIIRIKSLASPYFFFAQSTATFTILKIINGTVPLEKFDRTSAVSPSRFLQNANSSSFASSIISKLPWTYSTTSTWLLPFHSL